MNWFLVALAAPFLWSVVNIVDQYLVLKYAKEGSSPGGLVIFISLIGLVVLHELGHFFIAKKFGVKVEEFGIGFPPRLFGKKIGDTIYSLNLLPLGAFVKMPGEIEHIDDPDSFFQKAVWKRALIVFGGCLSFWIVAAILLSIIFALGAPVAVGDNDTNLTQPKVQIISVSSNSPAGIAGIMPGDTIMELKNQNGNLKIDTVKDVQEFTDANKGKEITMTVQRGKDILDLKLTPRVLPPDGEGLIGIGLTRTAIKSYPWYGAIWQGVLATFNLTIAVIQGWTQALTSVIKGLPSGVQVMGPVGIFNLFTQASTLGINYFLQFVAMISVYMAIFNVLPIPSVDGGKLLFLLIEAIKRKPLSQKIEQNITAVFFFALIALMIFVTIKDVIRIF